MIARLEERIADEPLTGFFFFFICYTIHALRGARSANIHFRPTLVCRHFGFSIVSLGVWGVCICTGVLVMIREMSGRRKWVSIVRVRVRRGLRIFCP